MIEPTKGLSSASGPEEHQAEIDHWIEENNK